MDRKAILLTCNKALERMRTHHIKNIANSEGPVVYISDTYPGVWMEHIYDSLVWADLTGENKVAKNYINLFIANQKEDGQLPCYVWYNAVGFSQLQECVSFGRLCLEAWQKNPDPTFLSTIYEACCKWDAWLCANRMTQGLGLIEMFCGYDTGHDNSGRLDGLKYPRNISANASDYPEGCNAAPIIAPDINACFYGNRIALSNMAKLLGKPQEANAWQEKANEVKKKLFNICYDEEDQFFYDVDKHGKMRKCRNISITNVFSEKLLDATQAEAIFNRYFLNENEFSTPYPYPSISVSDPVFEKRYKGNSWGYYSQGLTMLRTLRWMKDYGLESEMHKNMEKWLFAWTNSSIPFGQELDPFTGEPSECSPWYSSTMLFYLVSAKELGIFNDFN